MTNFKRDEAKEARESVYPCADCGEMRTAAEGGTVFTVCDACWDKRWPSKVPVPTYPRVPDRPGWWVLRGEVVRIRRFLRALALCSSEEGWVLVGDEDAGWSGPAYRRLDDGTFVALVEEKP